MAEDGLVLLGGVKEEQPLARAHDLEEGRFLFPAALALKVLLERPRAALRIPGPAGVEFRADDFAVAFPQLTDQEDVGEREEKKGPEHKEGGVPEIEPQAKPERLREG